MQRIALNISLPRKIKNELQIGSMTVLRVEPKSVIRVE